MCSRTVWISALCASAAFGIAWLLFTGSADRSAGGGASTSLTRDGQLDPLGRLEQRLALLESRFAGSPSTEPDSADAGATESTDDDAEDTDERLEQLESRTRALEALVSSLADEPMGRALAFLSADSGDLRRRGIRMLRDLARVDPDTRAAIRDRLDDPDDDVREEALDTLEEIRDLDSLPRILPLLADADAGLRAEAIESLGEMLEDMDPNDARVHEAALSIAERMADENPEVRENAVDVLGDLNAREAVPALVEALRDPERDVRREAIESLSDLRDPAAVAPLRALYDAGAGEDSMDLAVALKRLGDAEPFRREVEPLSGQATAGSTARERIGAIRRLSRYEDRDLRPIFEQALKDPDLEVQRQAREAIEDLDD